jgi:hypothetical protein
MSDAWMKNLGFGLTHDWRVSLTTRAPFQYNFVSIVLSRTHGVYTLKGAVMPQDAFLAAYHNQPVTLPEGHIVEAILPDAIGRTLEESLREVGVDTLPAKPLTGTDGMTITVHVWSESGTHHFEAWSPRGHHRDVLQLMIGLTSWYLGAFSSLPGVEPIRDWLARTYKEPSAPRPFTHCSGEIALAHEDADASQAWSMRIDELGVLRAEGSAFALREWVLGRELRDRILYALDFERIMAMRSRRLGFGDYAIELSVGARSITMLLGVGRNGAPDFSSLPRAVAASVGVLDGLRHDMRRGLSVLPYLPDLPRPVRTEGLLLRFRTHELRIWWSIFESGVIQAFVDADGEIAGSPLCPRLLISDEKLAELRALLRGIDLRVVDIRTGGENDGEVVLQCVVDGVLTTGRYAWTPHHHGHENDPAFRPGEFSRVLAISNLTGPLSTYSM